MTSHRSIIIVTRDSIKPTTAVDIRQMQLCIIESYLARARESTALNKHLASLGKSDCFTGEREREEDAIPIRYNSIERNRYLTADYTLST